MLGERKNVNLPGVVVDLPTLTDKDKEDILEWGVPNNIDMIALSFVRKGSDLVNVRRVLGPHAKRIKLMSKVHFFKMWFTFWVFLFDIHFVGFDYLLDQYNMNVGGEPRGSYKLR
jgi:Pyruvate kinase, barrel domain